MEDDNALRSSSQLRAQLGSMFYSEEPDSQNECWDYLERAEAVDPGHTEWLRGEILKILRENSTSIEERLFQYTDSDFEEGPQTAWDYWAYIWETVTNGEPWPADLPPANPDTFDFLRDTHPLPQE